MTVHNYITSREKECPEQLSMQEVPISLVEYKNTYVATLYI